MTSARPGSRCATLVADWPARDEYFAGFVPGSAPLGSHRELGDKVLSVLDDHDHVFGEKLRFAAPGGQ